MEKLGYLIKSLRECKGLTQKELSNGIMSISQLSKYERGETDTTDKNFFRLLKRMNISFSEFEVLYRKEVDTYQNFLDKFRSVIVKKEVSLLNELYMEELELENETGNYCHYHNQLLIKFHINKLLNIENDKRDIKKIVDYLYSVEDWGRYELMIFGNFSIFFSSERINEFVSRIDKKSYLFSNSKSFLEQIGRIMLNVIRKDLEEEQYRLASILIDKLEKMLKDTPLFYERLKVNYYKGILMIKNGNVNLGKAKVEQVIDFLIFIGEVERAHDYKKYAKMFLPTIYDK